MQLETYISDLLYRYNCVVVPNFGAFLTQRVSAKIHASTNVFYPPQKQLSFNEQIQQNDGVLAHYIADVEKIPFNRALEKINAHVKTIKSQLVEDETLSFKNIGTLALNSENNIQFEPSYKLNYLTDAFGLSQFTSPIIAKEELIEEVQDVEEEAVIPIGATTTKTKRYLRYAAIGLLLISLSGLIGGNWYSEQVQLHNIAAQENASKQVETKIQEATFAISNPLPVITLNVNTTHTNNAGIYHIIGGAFRFKANADKKIKQLKNKGFEAKHIGLNKHGLHQIAYASYSNRTEALNALKNIRAHYQKSAWMHVKTLN